VRLHADLVPVPGAAKPHAAVPVPVTQPPIATPSPSVAASKSDKPRVEKHSGRSASAAATSSEDIFETARRRPAGRKPASKPVTVSNDDIFESRGKSSGAATGDCVATISSKPWAEVSIDGKPTGKITPLVNYSIPCGKHRLTFKNADLMIERNESVTLKSGQPFKRIFSLVADEL